MDTITEIIRDLLIFIGAMLVLFVVLVVIITKLPRTNRLRQTLTALAFRVAATWGVALIDIPASAMPPVGEIWDIGTLLILAYYWYTFFRDDGGRAIRALRDAMQSARKPR
jgi:hypothetical protein